MTIRKLTKEGEFEAGIEAIVAGKVWAYTPVIAFGKRGALGEPPFGLGIAIANEPKYHPVPIAWCHGDNWEEMAEHADELNRARGLTDEHATEIVISSMFHKDRPR